MSHKSAKNAKNDKTYDILKYKKGFISTLIVDGKTIEEYFQFKEIQQIILHPNVGVEIVLYNGGKRHVFYNDTEGAAEDLFTYLNTEMKLWMASNLN